MAGKLRAPSLQRLHDIFDFSPETVSEAEVQAGMPQFSQPPADSVYKPINMPVDRDVGLQDIPPGFAITEEGVRDPQGKPAKFRSPSVGQVLSKLGTDILPVAGGTLPALAKGAIGAANGVDKLANGFTMGSGPIRQTVYRVVPDAVPDNAAFRPREAGGGTYVFGDKAQADEFKQLLGGKVLSAEIDAHKPRFVDDFTIEVLGLRPPSTRRPNEAKVYANNGSSGLYTKGTQLFVRDPNLIDPTTIKKLLALPAAAIAATAGSSDAQATPLSDQDKPDHNDFVERVRREAREAPPPKKRPEQKPVPAIMGIRG